MAMNARLRLAMNARLRFDDRFTLMASTLEKLLRPAHTLEMVGMCEKVTEVSYLSQILGAYPVQSCYIHLQTLK